MLKSIGRYRLRRVLASDALTHTHEGTAPDSDERLLVRVGKVPVKLSAEQRAKLDADAKAAAALPREHADVVIDHGIAHGLPYVVSPWVEARSLAEALAASPGALPAEGVIALGLDAATGLHAAHAAGLVHGAISPDTVWVDASARARLTGWALSAVCVSAAAAHPQLAAMARKDVPPEGGPGAAAGDLYALAGVLCVALTGAGDLAAVGHEPLREVLARLRASDPEERGSAADLVGALARLAPGPEGRRKLADALGLELPTVPRGRPQDPEVRDSDATARVLFDADPPGAPPRGLPLSSVSEKAPRLEGEDATATGFELRDETVMESRSELEVAEEHPPLGPADHDTDLTVLPEHRGRDELFDAPTFVDKPVERTELLAPEVPLAPRTDDHTLELVLPDAGAAEPPRVRAPELERARAWWAEQSKKIVFGWPLPTLVAMGGGALLLVVTCALFAIWLAS